ncbi:MAG: hypothetical protein MJE77_09600 [Proteobacteria bacterium]|nr:hypothetical protein [Pseudomonadota bacterium]
MTRITTLVIALIIVLCPPTWAQDDDSLPPGKFGVSVGVRQGFGQLGDDFGPGAVGAIEAGFHPAAFDQRLSIGLHWSVAWGWFGFVDNQASVTGSLKLLELHFGTRIRRMLGDPQRFLWLGTGVTLLRSNVPIPPDLERDYIGPHVSLGAEQFLAGSFIVSFEARYGLIVGGPRSISLALGIAFGH